MLLIACPLTLLVIFAGMKLLAQTKKETLGNLYRYVSWFLIIMGFLILIGISGLGALRCCHKEERMMEMERKFKLMEDRHYDGACMMRNQTSSCTMCGTRKMKEHCGNMMMEEVYYTDGQEKNCHGCKDGYEKTDGECRHKKGECDEKSELCHTKKGDICKKDSLKKK